MHRQAAQRLAGLDAPPAAIARHWLAGGSPAEATSWLLAAARDAVRLAAFSDALRHLEPLLAYQPDHPEALRLRAEALDAHRRSGRGGRVPGRCASGGRAGLARPARQGRTGPDQAGRPERCAVGVAGRQADHRRRPPVRGPGLQRRRGHGHGGPGHGHAESRRGAAARAPVGRHGGDRGGVVGAGRRRACAGRTAPQRPGPTCTKPAICRTWPCECSTASCASPSAFSTARVRTRRSSHSPKRSRRRRSAWAPRAAMPSA